MLNWFSGFLEQQKKYTTVFYHNSETPLKFLTFQATSSHEPRVAWDDFLMAVPSGKARIPARTSTTQVPNDCYPSNLVTGDSRGPRWRRLFSAPQVFFYIKKTSSFGWFEDREFPLLLRENQFLGEGVQHIQAFVGGGDLVKTLSRWPCTHLDLKVECYDDLISLTETPPGRVSRLNTCDMLAMNVLLCLASTTLPKTMGLCICEDILAETRGFFGTLVWNAKKKEDVVLAYTARMLPRSVKPDGSFSGYTFIYIYIN